MACIQYSEIHVNDIVNIFTMKNNIDFVVIVCLLITWKSSTEDSNYNEYYHTRHSCVCVVIISNESERDFLYYYFKDSEQKKSITLTNDKKRAIKYTYFLSTCSSFLNLKKAQNEKIS